MKITFVENLVKLVAIISDIKTPSFVRIDNYRNDRGEVANYLINLGVKYENAKAKDIEFLKDSENLKTIDFDKYKGQAEQARIEMLASRLNPSNRMSKAQSDAYQTLCPNVRLHKDSQRVFIYGFVVSKEVLVEGDSKPTASSSLTRAKNKIEKVLKGTQFRQFAFDRLADVKVKGNDITITLEL